MTQQSSITLSFNDNQMLAELVGEAEANLKLIAERLGVEVHSRGSMVSLSGQKGKVLVAEEILRTLYRSIQHGNGLNKLELEGLIRTVSESREGIRRQKGRDDDATDQPNLIKGAWQDIIIKTPRKHLHPLSVRQAAYMQALQKKDVVFAAGPAGTGKTYIAVSAAAEAFSNGDVERIILSRPAVEAGEKIGFLPGDMKDKVDPYLRPLYDALYDMLPPEKVVRLLETGQVEIAPLAFMRGRTLRNAYVILDEAQNCTPVQMKMFLTRLGEGSRMAITGDLSQTDLPDSQRSGFSDALDKLQNIPEIAITKLTQADVVRHPVTAKIVAAYEEKGH